MVAIAIGSLCALALTFGSDPVRGFRWTPLVVAMLASWAWTIVQALPASCSFVSVLAPESNAELQRVEALLGAPRAALCTLSRAPAATREEIVKGIGINAAFLAAFILARRGHARFIYRTVACSGIALALVAAGHFAVHATRVFGVYEPVEIRHQPFLAPIMNLNTLGGFLAMCLPVVVGLALGEAPGLRRSFWLVSTGVLASCALLTRSRGAVGALVVGMSLLLVLGWRHRAPRSARRRRSSPVLFDRVGISLAIAAALGLGVYGSYAEVLHEFRVGGFEKLELIRVSLDFAAAHPWVGVGRGAFGSAFASVYGSINRFEYAENFLAQWACEWGFPIAVSLVAAIAHACLRARRRGRSIERMGALAGLSALAAQNLVDIGLELVGVAVVAAALLGAVTAHATRSHQRSTGVGASRRIAPWVGLGAAACILVLLAGGVMRDHGLYLRTELETTLQAGDRAGFRRTLARAVRGYPSDPVFAVLAASEALQHHDAGAGRWINRAMQLAPGWTAPHVQAVEWLWNAGRREQALVELGVAMDLGPQAARAVMCRVARVDLGGALRAVPAGEQRRLSLELVARCFDPRSKEAGRVDAVIAREFPNDGRAELRTAQRALANGDHQGAIEAAVAARQAAPELTVESSIVEARALRAQGRLEEAVAALQRAQRFAPSATAPVIEEAELQAQRTDATAMRAALARLHGLSASSAQDTARAFMLAASLERKLGNLGGALRAYDQAYGITGETAALGGIADTALALGDRPRAIWAYGLLCDLAGTDRSACDKRDQLTAGRFEFRGKAAQPIQR
jgi:hypothetical protein